MKYLKNARYVAALSDELETGQLLSRTYFGEKVVLFRDSTGAPHGLADRCPHRFVPLSEGTLQSCGDAIQCRYHGLQFGIEGTCVHNPQGIIPKAAAVHKYVLSEKSGLIWLWAGDPARADERLVPDYAEATLAPEHSIVRGYMPTDCNYELIVDNILDLSHTDFLHPTTLGSGKISQAKPQVSDPSDTSVKIEWLSVGEKAPPAFDMHLRKQQQATDQWTSVAWTAPSTMKIVAGATLQGETREQGVNIIAIHLATPMTETTSHYWYWSTRSFAINPEANAHTKTFIEHVFQHEDKPMLEAQERSMGTDEFWDLKPVLLPADSGSVRSRRKLQALIEAEQPQTA